MRMQDKKEGGQKKGEVSWNNREKLTRQSGGYEQQMETRREMRGERK